MKRICIVIVYIGKWPDWFDIFLQSCTHNPTVNWIIFTDCEIPEYCPDNIKFVAMNLDNFNALASSKLNLKIAIKNGIKLSDLRPAFGLVFEEYLTDFDFWGHCDVDLIFGNIKAFITEEMLSENDIITSHEEYLTGHFTLYRNTKKINRLFEHSADYAHVFQSSNHYFFEERWPPTSNFKPRVDRILEIGGISKLDSQIERMDAVANTLACEGKIRVHKSKMMRADGRKQKWVIHWREGTLVDTIDGWEMLYFHFIFHKNYKRFLMPEWKSVPDEFYIGHNGFYTKDMLTVKRKLQTMAINLYHPMQYYRLNRGVKGVIRDWLKK